MTELKQVIAVGAIAIIGMALLFVMNYPTTGLIQYKEGGAAYRQKVCSQVMPDTTLPLTDCMIQSQQLCAEIHVPYLSELSKFNTCYNTCVFNAQSMCYQGIRR